MEIKTLLTKRNFTAMKNKVNKYIVIHFVGAVSSALNNAKYFETVYRGASAHYFIDDKDCYQVVREKDASWHCGAKYYKHLSCRNSNSIGIEMCCFRNSKGELDISEATINRTVELVRELMAKYNIPIENVLRHYDVTGKNCPAPFVKDKKAWEMFKKRLENKDKIKYKVHVQNIGWQEEKENGELAGTEGESLRIEAIIIDSTIPLQYRVHIQDKGWSEWVPQGCMAGTVGEGKRLEAIEIISQKEIKATAHIQDIGWQETTRGTQIKIGTEGRGLRLEALKLEFI